MNDPLISVLMPVYNAERYVAEAVESILAQTLTDFEFLIIDDGSTDGSLTILKRYAARDSRIRLVSRPNTGYLVALNEGIGLARSESIARMDADDVSSPGRFAAQFDYLRDHPECLAVGCGVLLIDSDGQPLCEWTNPESHEEIDEAHLHGLGGAIAHPATMFRRGILLAIGGYRLEMEFAEDLDLFLRLSEYGRLANVPRVLFRYRQHIQSVGYRRQAIQQERARAAVSEARHRRGLPVREDEIRDFEFPCTVADHHQKWAWWALRAGNIRTARKHALRSMCYRPLSAQSWRAIACALRGY
ncbi:MAG: glycosyltransferase family 2 protein [Solirubrobacterales bacterium]